MSAQTDSLVPNLDAMESDRLMEFWLTHQRGRAYRKLFPIGGAGSKKATSDLANYASNKATAIRCRLCGEIGTAMMYEQIADRIYSDLPTWARW